MCLGSPWRLTGSSPRTWGTPNPGWLNTVIGRFIPTYMGNASRCSTSPKTPTVHPHVHGERSTTTPSAVRCAGSSPRTWGTHETSSFSPNTIRFIPTYMGNATTPTPPPLTRTVHPHVHGERTKSELWGWKAAGSSPRTWGTPSGGEKEKILRRFIPTYMGNAFSRISANLRVSVHPHVHGERNKGERRRSYTSGSSPRTWGTLRSSDIF